MWHFLAQSALADEYVPVFCNNWQFILQELPIDMLFTEAAKAAVFIYQPTDQHRDKMGNLIPSSEDLIRNVVPKDAKRISFAYQYNNGFFPIIKETDKDYATGQRVRELAKGDKHAYWQAYNSGAMFFDCAKRFVDCLTEQHRREMTCDIEMVPFILENFRKRRLFLNQNHPASCMFVELARRVYLHVYGDGDDLDDLDDGFLVKSMGDNDAGMNGELPMHPAAVRELGLEFGPYGDQTVYEGYLEAFRKLSQPHP